MGLLPANSGIARLRDRVLNKVTMQVYEAGRKQLNEARKGLGLNTLRSVFDLLDIPKRLLVLSSAAFDYPAALPANVGRGGSLHKKERSCTTIVTSQYTLYCKEVGSNRMRSKLIWIIVVGLLALAVYALIVSRRGRAAVEPAPQAAIIEKKAGGSVYGYEVVREYPHDANAFTQGLIYVDGFLCESTGITGRSSVRKVRLETGEVIQQRAVNRADYGEGLTEWRGRLIQLTPRRRGSEPIWHVRKFFEDIRRHFGDNVGVTYDITSFEPGPSFEYPGDGWGLTHDDHRLIMSDGSSKLRFLEPESFAELGRLEVFDGKEPVEYLNELEFVEGEIYANVQQQDRIAIIQPDSGQVTGWIDLAGLKSRMPPLPSEPLRAVLNGIAYDAAGRRLFVTGKLWPKVFEIRVTPR
jgi:glutaminyl-peptide cyclotransferase